jgi:hypothetical protein
MVGYDHEGEQGEEEKKKKVAHDPEMPFAAHPDRMRELTFGHL